MSGHTRVRDLMERNVLTIHCQESVAKAEGLLVEHCVSGVPMVATDGHVMGVVSLTDIARFRWTRPGDDPHAVMVYEIGTPETITVSGLASVEEAARTMVENQVHRLVVLEGGRPVGIVSSLDVVRFVAQRS